jgi:putative flippase GtrA
MKEISLFKKFEQFLGFVILSGLGWLCDFGTYTCLVALSDISPFVLNFISSYVGVTFVWYTSLKRVFRATGPVNGPFLIAYWAFQLVSILAYSKLLIIVVSLLKAESVSMEPVGQPAVLAKIIVTPATLLTNFLFMKTLTRFMRK